MGHIPGVSKKYGVANLQFKLRLVQWKNVIFVDVMDASIIQYCVQFQPHTLNETKITYARWTVGQTGLRW